MGEITNGLILSKNLSPAQQRQVSRLLAKGRVLRLSRGAYISTQLWRHLGNENLSLHGAEFPSLQGRSHSGAHTSQHSGPHGSPHSVAHAGTRTDQHTSPHNINRSINHKPEAPHLNGERRQAIARIVAHTNTAGNAVVTGKSAAILHGLPLESFTPPDTIELGTFYRGGIGASASLEWTYLPARMRPHVVTITTEFGPVTTTDCLGTCLQLALHHSLNDAVIAAEYALNQNFLSWENWQDAETLIANRRGVKQARTVFQLVTPWSESPRESLLKILMFQHGLPAPFQQVTIRNSSGMVLGRPDYYFDVGLATEYDGRSKYGFTEDQVRKALHQERLRENLIQAEGVHFIRVTSETFCDGTALRHIETMLHNLRDRGPLIPREQWHAQGRAWRESP